MSDVPGPSAPSGAQAGPSTAASADLVVGSASGSRKASEAPTTAQGSALDKVPPITRSKKACDGCAKVKMRCIRRSEDEDDWTCQRCVRLGRDCVYSEPAKKQRRMDDGSACNGASAARQPQPQPPPSPPDRQQPQLSLPLQQHQPPFFPPLAPQPAQNAPLPLPARPQDLLDTYQHSNSDYSPEISSLPSLAPLMPPVFPAPSTFPFLSPPSQGESGSLASSEGPFGKKTAATGLPVDPSSSVGTSRSSFGSTSGSRKPSGKSDDVLRRKRFEMRNLVNPLGLLVQASLDVPKTSPDASGSDGGRGTDDGMGGPANHATSESHDTLLSSTAEEAGEIYFRPAGLSRAFASSSGPPAALQVLTTQQVQELFDLFYSRYHIHAPIIDQEHGSPVEIAARSHFLFHAILGIASLSWSGPLDVHHKLLQIVAAELTVLPREHTLECVQANLLCATWNPVSPRHVDLDEQYLRVGLAVRLAMDLRLHETDMEGETSDVPQSVLASQRRTWALCYIFDAKLSAHRGRNCYTPDVGLQGLEVLPSSDDLRTMSSVEWCRIVGRIHKNRPVTPANMAEVFQHADAIDWDLLQWKDNWVANFSQAPIERVQTLLARTRLYFHYAQLLNYASVLQSTVSETASENSVHASKYLESVNRLLYTFVEDFGIHRIATYLSDLHFTYVAFTAVSLIHAITIGFGCRPAEASSAVRLVKRVANLFESSAGTVRHNLRSQAHFLRAVLHAKLDESGQPRAKAPSLEDWTLTVAGLDSAFLDALGPAAAPDANAEAATLLNTAAGPAAVDFDSLNATLNSSQVLSNKDFDTAYWSVMLGLSQGN